jgi:endogenous inhibitor of DNA gyrase (YacG/DUF329 family)
MSEADLNSARRMVSCPACRGPSPYNPENAWRPFCSARCQGLDLGAWAAEGYRLAEPQGGAEAAAGDGAGSHVPTDAGSAGLPH